MTENVVPFAFPTVICSLDGTNTIVVTAFEGAHKVTDRSARALYFTYRTKPRGDDLRVSVIFSNWGVTPPSDFGVPDYGEQDANLLQYALAALGEELNSGQPLPATPSGMKAHEVECFSARLNEWLARESVSDETGEAYMKSRLVRSMSCGVLETAFSSSDLLRLRWELADLDRISSLWVGEYWTVRGYSQREITLTPTVQLLRAQRVPSKSPPSESLASIPAYVDEQRLIELRAITTTKFDLTRLIRLADELNVCNANSLFFCTAMLTRAILDHVPPVFGAKSFSEVANGYAGTKSFKNSMKHLDNSARAIADAHLHTQLRPKETLPTRVQVDFSRDLDVLLGEIVRLLG